MGAHFGTVSVNVGKRYMFVNIVCEMEILKVVDAGKLRLQEIT